MTFKIKLLFELYIDNLKNRAFSPNTIRSKKRAFKKFDLFLQSKKISSIHAITRKDLSLFQKHLRSHVTSNGCFIKIKTQNDILVSIKTFFDFLEYQDLITANPAKFIQFAKEPKEIIRNILTNNEVSKILGSIDIHTIDGFRNRAILELLYSTGIRIMELINLNLCDLDLENKELRILNGKGKKDRLVPLNNPAHKFLKNYTAYIRPVFAKNFKLSLNNALRSGKSEDNQALFLNIYGERMRETGLRHMLKKYLELANIKKNVSFHSFRHTLATELLRNGVQLRYIQALLGHKSITATQIYTKVVIEDLKKAYKKFHPRNKID
ncbi:tyrosine-type recombinase/integrase [Candidatus Margulisiibacteriota bacterium]